jgi:ubiquinone/menaquinone biosynthesis C-methylase UbiE
MTMDNDIVSAGYNAVYAGTPNSPTLRRLWREHAEGPDFPDEFGHISFTTLAELQRMSGLLRLSPGDTLVDVGCGRGGPALWMSRETGARLIGVDLSPVAAQQATARAADLGLVEQATFVAAPFVDTGLDAGFADAVMSEDALQYAPDKRAAFAEAARILRPDGRLVFTAYELDPARAAGLPAWSVDPVDDYRAVVTGAGFSIDVYEEVSGWPEPMTTTYSALIAARAALVEEMGEVAANALTMEMTMTLQQKPYRRAGGCSPPPLAGKGHQSQRTRRRGGASA